MCLCLYHLSSVYEPLFSLICKAGLHLGSESFCLSKNQLETDTMKFPPRFRLFDFQVFGHHVIILNRLILKMVFHLRLTMDYGLTMIRTTMFFSVLLVPIVIMAQPEVQPDGNGDGEMSKRVSDLLNAFEAVLDSCWNDNKVIPYVDNKEYIRKMAQHVTMAEKKRVLVIGGAKDTGKTTGLFYFSRAAASLGYFVFEVDLKGTTDIKSMERVLGHLAMDSVSTILEMDDVNELACTFNKIIQCPAIKESWGMVVDYIVAIVATGAIGLALVHCVNYLQLANLLRSRFRVILIILTLVILLFSWYSGILRSRLMYHLSFTMFLLQQRIAQGEWATTFCSYNAIASCTTYGPIFVVRDVENFQPSDLHKFF